MNALRALLALLAVAVSMVSIAQVPDRSRENLMVVVRESIGANRPDDAFTPTGKVRARLPDGRVIEMEMASWEYIGDTHIRFVFDGPQTMINATPADLSKLGLNGVDDALALALINIKRVYGEPSARLWEAGVYQIHGKSPDLDSSYFLDRAYWRQLLKIHPEGLVVGLPKRGGLLYAPVTDSKAVEGLKRGIRHLHASSEGLRVSSALFLFKDGKWSVFQSPAGQ